MTETNIKNMISDREELLSKTISFLRFPLMVGVVLIHSRIGGEWMERVSANPTADFPIYSAVSYLLSSVIAAIAVPLYFFFSGFLFFYRTSFDSHVYFHKLKTRCQTLLVPYLLWNLIALLLTFALQTFFPEMIAGTKGVRDYSLTDYLWCFWDFQKVHHGVWSSMTPINDPLWFIRNLMVVILCTPLIYLFLKRLKHYGVLLLATLWMFRRVLQIPEFDITTLFFFSAGAYFSIYRKDFVELLKPPYVLPSAFLLYSISSVLLLCFRTASWASYLKDLILLIGMVLAISLTSRNLAQGRWRVNPFLTESSLFIYLYHGLIVYRLTSRTFMFLPHSEAMLLLTYFLCPAIVILFGLCSYCILKRFSPRMICLLMGYRVNKKRIAS